MQKITRFGNLLAIGLRGDIAHARRAAAFDLILQTGPRPVLENRVGAGAQQKNFLQQIHGFVQRPDRSERTKILAFFAMRAAMFFNARERVVMRDQQFGKAFIVLEQNIIARRKPLDEAGLHQQRLGFVLRYHHFHTGNLRHHAQNAGGKVTRGGIVGHAVMQVFCFAHVKQLTSSIDHAVNAGTWRNGFESQPYCFRANGGSDFSVVHRG